MTIKEIIEKYSELAKSSELGENKKVTRLEFSGFERITITAQYNVTACALRNTKDMSYIKQKVTENLNNYLIDGLRKQELINRESESCIYGTTFIESIFCLKSKD